MSGTILYTGNSFGVADGKGRFVLPLEMRKQVKLSSGNEGRLCLSFHISNGCALGFGQSHRDHLFAEVERMQEAGREIDAERLLEDRLGMIEEVNFDEGGRFFMHPDIALEAGITDAVFFYGVGRHIQIWNPQALEASEDRPALIRNKARRWLDERARAAK